MKITSKHKAYAVLLGLGFAAFGMDRGLSKPESAEAAPVLAQAIPSQTAADQAANPAVTANPSLAIAKQLQALAQADQINPDASPNAFAPSRNWVLVQPSASTGAVATNAQDFARTHQLSAIMQSNKGGQAIINGQLLRLGQVVDGMKILAIGRNSVRMGNAAGQFDLNMVTSLSSADIQSN